MLRIEDRHRSDFRRSFPRRGKASKPNPLLQTADDLLQRPELEDSAVHVMVGAHDGGLALVPVEPCRDYSVGLTVTLTTKNELRDSAVFQGRLIDILPSIHKEPPARS